MDSDDSKAPTLPQPLRDDGFLSPKFANMISPDGTGLKQRQFRNHHYSPLANGYSMLVLEDETGTWRLVFDEIGNLIPGVFDDPGKAAEAAEEHYGDSTSTQTPTSP